MCLIDATVDLQRDQQQLTRMFPLPSSTFHTREYGERIDEQKTFVFNPSINAVNGRSGAYYSTGSLGQIGAVYSGGQAFVTLRHINLATHSHAELFRLAQSRTMSLRKWAIRPRRGCTRFMTPGC